MADSATTPRLVISRMVLENFKSYAGAQHVGPFHKVCGLAHLLKWRKDLTRYFVCSLSLLLSVPMGAASLMSLTPCYLCLGSEPNRYFSDYWTDSVHILVSKHMLHHVAWQHSDTKQSLCCSYG